MESYFSQKKHWETHEKHVYIGAHLFVKNMFKNKQLKKLLFFIEKAVENNMEQHDDLEHQKN